MNFKGQEIHHHVPQCLPGMDKRANNLRAECFHRFLVIVSTEHGQWQASFTPEKSTDKPRLVDFTEVSKFPRKTWGAVHAQTVCTRRQALPPIFRVPGNETREWLALHRIPAGILRAWNHY